MSGESSNSAPMSITEPYKELLERSRVIQSHTTLLVQLLDPENILSLSAEERKEWRGIVENMRAKSIAVESQVSNLKEYIEQYTNQDLKPKIDQIQTSLTEMIQAITPWSNIHTYYSREGAIYAELQEIVSEKKMNSLGFMAISMGPFQEATRFALILKEMRANLRKVLIKNSSEIGKQDLEDNEEAVKQREEKIKSTLDSNPLYQSISELEQATKEQTLLYNEKTRALENDLCRKHITAILPLLRKKKNARLLTPKLIDSMLNGTLGNLMDTLQTIAPTAYQEVQHRIQESFFKENTEQYYTPSKEETLALYTQLLPNKLQEKENREKPIQKKVAPTIIDTLNATHLAKSKEQWEEAIKNPRDFIKRHATPQSNDAETPKSLPDDMWALYTASEDAFGNDTTQVNGNDSSPPAYKDVYKQPASSTQKENGLLSALRSFFRSESKNKVQKLQKPILSNEDSDGSIEMYEENLTDNKAGMETVPPETPPPAYKEIHQSAHSDQDAPPPLEFIPGEEEYEPDYDVLLGKNTAIIPLKEIYADSANNTTTTDNPNTTETPPPTQKPKNS